MGSIPVLSLRTLTDMPVIDSFEDLENLEPYTFVCGADMHLDPADIREYRRKFSEGRTRVRWVTHPELSVSGVCPECKEYSGKFMSMEQVAGLQPVHPNCVCGYVVSP